MLRLAIPLALAELGWMAMSVVDVIMVGHIMVGHIMVGHIMVGHMMVGRLPSSAGAIGAASRGLLLSALDGDIVVLASVPLMLEYEAVLTRREHPMASGLSTADTNAVLDSFAAVAEPIRFRFLWRPQLKDPADEMVLETAVNGGANRLVTSNLRHLRHAALKFGIVTATPPEAWKEIVGIHEKK